SGRGRAQSTMRVTANVALSLHDIAPRLETGRWSGGAHTGRSHGSSSHAHPIANGGIVGRMHVAHGAASDVERRTDHNRSASGRSGWGQRAAGALRLTSAWALHR